MRKSGRYGFTLIELLAVIAIISLLMGILLPAMNRARAQSKRAACLSNIKQLTVVWLMYADDNDYKLVSANTTGGSDWVCDGEASDPSNTIGNTEEAIKSGAFFHYTKSVELYKCPADRSERLRSYSISYYMNGEKSIGGNNISKKAIPQIRMPDKKLVFMGEYDWQGKVSWNVNSWRLDNEGRDWLDDISGWHSNGINMSFADTHVEYHKWKDKQTIKYALNKADKPTNDDNVDFEFLWKATGGKN